MAESTITPPPQPAAPAWHTLPGSDAAAQLAVDPNLGLSGAEAAARAARFGPNSIREKPPRAAWRMFLAQFADFMVLVLIAAALISGLIGDWKDTIAIVVIVLLNSIIGFVQESRAERALMALKRLSAANAKILRDGERRTLPAQDLVPGDIVLLDAGDLVPADLRLVEAAQLKLDEALLTGESATVEKRIEPLPDPALPLGDRLNMAYKGATATYGRGRGIVVATGMETELGRIAALLDTGVELKTPLQKRLAAFGKRLGLFVLAVCSVIFGLGLLRGESAVLMFLTAISLAVAAIPEALPAVVTILLALGARRMVKQRALIRRLPAVETLGSVTYICSDKTGTLTQNRMRVEQLHPAHDPAALLTALALSNDASRGHDGQTSGDPTEVALFLAALDAGYDKSELQAAAPRVLELPFDSERKRMTTFHSRAAGAVAYTKGAPESVLPLCTADFTPADRQRVLATADSMAAGGLRVLAVAQREWDHLPAAGGAEPVEASLSFLGLVGLMDPPRPEARQAVDLCTSAGIVPVMITGDHPATARAIAHQVGITAEDALVMTGPQLARLSDAEFHSQVASIQIYARVSPAQKIRIVEALQARGEFVAMTGDGVNDAPALKRADIGIAMGLGGTDVAREASSLVLLDDNFATIVAAVREGRHIFDNIRKFIKYTMTSNSAEVWTILLAPFLGLPIPLLPIHILWVNLVTDGLPGLALAAEPEEPGIMRRPPRLPKESIFAHGMWQHMIWAGLLMAAVTLFAQAMAIQAGSTHWRTMVFTVLTLSQMGHVWAIRSETQSLFQQGLLSNRPLLGAVALTFVLQMATIYIPALNPVFNTQPLSAAELAFSLLLSTVVFFAVEVEKWMRRRGWIFRDGRAGR